MRIFFFLPVHTNSSPFPDILHLSHKLNDLQCHFFGLSFDYCHFNFLAPSPIQTIPNRTIYSHALALLCIHDTLQWSSMSSKAPITPQLCSLFTPANELLWLLWIHQICSCLMTFITAVPWTENWPCFPHIWLAYSLYLLQIFIQIPHK